MGSCLLINYLNVPFHILEIQAADPEVGRASERLTREEDRVRLASLTERAKSFIEHQVDVDFLVLGRKLCESGRFGLLIESRQVHRQRRIDGRPLQ